MPTNVGEQGVTMEECEIRRQYVRHVINFNINMPIMKQASSYSNSDYVGKYARKFGLEIK